MTGPGRRPARPADPARGAPVPVVAAVVERDGRYLLARRPAEKRHPGLWEFPGGKLRAGEDHAAAAARELAEELAVELAGAGAVLWSARDPGSEYRIDFLAVEMRGEPQALEHDTVGWFTPSELETMPLAPADARFAERLRGVG